jgi:hypothetical protein
VDTKYNLRYIAKEISPQRDVLPGEALGEPHHELQQGGVLQDEEHDDKVKDNDFEEVGINEIPAKVYASQTAVRQPLEVCDQESDLPCYFADCPEQIPLPGKRSNIPALEA